MRVNRSTVTPHLLATPIEMNNSSRHLPTKITINEASCADHDTGWLLVLPWDVEAPGGVNQVVSNLLEFIPRILGNRTLLMVKTWGQLEPIFEIRDSTKIVRMELRSPWIAKQRIRSLAAFILRFPAAVRRIRKLLRDERIKTINVHYPDLDALSLLATRKLTSRRLRLILSFHGTDFAEARSTSGFARRLWEFLLKHSDEILVCSDEMQGQLVEAFPASRSHIRTVFNGVSPDAILLHTAQEPKVNLPCNFISSLATFEHNKGLDVLIDAFNTIASRHPTTHLVIAGRIGAPDYFKQLDERRRSAGSSERIIFLTDLSHADAMRVLSRSTINILPSRRESFGIVVLEAGVLGIPVIASENCGVSRVLKPGFHLRTVPAEDVRALSQAIDELITDRSSSQIMAGHLKAKVLAEFTWDRIVLGYQAPAK